MKKIILVLFLSSVALAKVVDPQPLRAGNIEYRSHGNEVTATQVDTSERLWRTRVYSTYKPSEYIPGLEQDVQWNIISRMIVSKGILLVETSKGESYRLNAKTGRILKKTLKK